MLVALVHHQVVSVIVVIQAALVIVEIQEALVRLTRTTMSVVLGLHRIKVYRILYMLDKLDFTIPPLIITIKFLTSRTGFGGGFGNTQTNNNANKGFGSSAGGFGTTQNSSSGFGGGGFGQQSNPTQTMNASQGFGNNQNTGFGAVNPANPANNAMNLRQASPLNGTDVATNQFNDGVSCLAFSPNMQSLQQYWGNVQEVLLSGHWDNTVQIWTVNTIGKKVFDNTRDLNMTCFTRALLLSTVAIPLTICRMSYPRLTLIICHMSYPRLTLIKPYHLHTLSYAFYLFYSQSTM